PRLDEVPSGCERRQTLTTAERFVTPGLKVKGGEIVSAEEKLKALEHERFVEVREFVAGFVPQLQLAAQTLADLDATSTLAEVASRFDWGRPTLDDSDRLALEEAR